MLLNFIKSMLQPAKSSQFAPIRDASSTSLTDELQFVHGNHARCDANAHNQVLFHGSYVGGTEFLPLYQQGLSESGTEVKALKAFHRPQAALNLLRYFEYSLDVPGARAECGVFLGLTSWLMCQVAKRRNDNYRGEDMYLVDSFAGFPTAGADDLIARREGDQIAMKPTIAAGEAAVPVEHVRALLAGFPQLGIHKGWIPEVLAQLPKTQWSFVHIDVDLYDATLACLKFFAPNLAPGGVILCDDYRTPLFPGAGKAWRLYCLEHAIPFVVLDTGQSVIMSPRLR